MSEVNASTLSSGTSIQHQDETLEASTTLLQLSQKDPASVHPPCGKHIMSKATPQSGISTTTRAGGPVPYIAVMDEDNDGSLRASLAQEPSSLQEPVMEASGLCAVSPESVGLVAPSLLVLEKSHPSTSTIMLKSDTQTDFMRTHADISTRVDSTLKTLFMVGSFGLSPLKSMMTRLTKSLRDLVKNVARYEDSDFEPLMIQIQEFSDFAPNSMQSTIHHLKSSVSSMRAMRQDIAKRGPIIYGDLERKETLISSGEELQAMLQEKHQDVATLRDTHASLSTKIEALEAELVRLRGERAAIGDQLLFSEKELVKLTMSVTKLEQEVVSIVASSKTKAQWDQDMEIFTAAIIGLINQFETAVNN